MDYGRTNPSTDTPEFFTSDVGTNDENVNNFEANNNLDLSNSASTWEQPVLIEHNERAIGNKTKISSELPMPSSELPSSPQLGEFIDLNPGSTPVPKPFEEQSEQGPANKNQDIESFEHSFDASLESIKTTDRLSEEGVKAIENEKQDFIQTGNAEQFYTNVRTKMLPKHMEQSYGINSNWGRKAS